MSFANTGSPATRSRTPLQPCALIDGKYRLEALIGEGGMGKVWRARNVMLDLPVAIKVLHPELRGTDTVARLLTEARVEAKLQHASVVRVFDYGEADSGQAYIVMELLEGSTLADLIAEHGAIDAKFAVGLLLPVIDALRAAHRAGVVHRDLKPENIFLAQAGSHVQPKLLDFGIAKLRDEPKQHGTKRAPLLGSPSYMSPEQAHGVADVDARADVWAICVVLYEMISGRGAFDADNPYRVLRAVVEQDLPALPGCPKLWKILQCGLAKDRSLRFASAAELGCALANWLAATGEAEDASGEPLAWNWPLRDHTQRSARPRRRSRLELNPVPESTRDQVTLALLPRNVVSGWRSTCIRAACLVAVVPVCLLLNPHNARGNHHSGARGIAMQVASAQDTFVPTASTNRTPIAAVADVVESVPAADSGAAAPARLHTSSRSKHTVKHISTTGLGLKDPFR